MALHVTARFVARDESREALRKILDALVDPVRRDPGCERCHFTQSQTNPNEFVFIEEWKDDAALDRHLAEAYVAKAIEDTSSLLAEPVDLQRFDAID